MTDAPLEIFLSTVPGLEGPLCMEALEHGFKNPQASTGGVTITGDWREVWRANLTLRGAAHVLVRLGSFRAVHLAQLDKRARKFSWGETLRPDVPVRVEATCRKSRIYHDKAASERLETALKEEFGAVISKDAAVVIKARISEDICTISVETSGEPLHKRGHKIAVNKAPMRENLAALLLRASGYTGTEPVVDPMCGSGTFVLEAAEIAASLMPGRTRAFAFEHLASFDADIWAQMKADAPTRETDLQFHGFDRDKGAVHMSGNNAKRAGVEGITNFTQQAISDLTPPEGPTGLVMINPPYGARIGDQKKLMPLYQTLGSVLRARFTGWRVGLVTNSDALAQATELSFRKKKHRFSHGGIPVKLYSSTPLS